MLLIIIYNNLQIIYISIKNLFFNIIKSTMAELSTKPLKFSYWNTRGRGMPIRFLLAYSELPYEEKVYTLTPE
jgi:hypothetical protein